MLYRPHFCCHCGEKIIRSKWTPLTSRRFCDFCAVEQKQHDLLPRVAAVILLIFGAAGITSYLGSGKSISHPSSSDRVENRTTGPNVRGVSANTSSNSLPSVAQDTAKPVNSAVNIKQLAPKAASSTEAVYYCGALTKKGTACTRRVKSPGRCWQHLGQPAARDGRK
jgi:hypothetical protein